MPTVQYDHGNTSDLGLSDVEKQIAEDDKNNPNRVSHRSLMKSPNTTEGRRDD